MALVDSIPVTVTGAWVVAKREIRDQLRDWRILTPILILTLFFPVLMNFTAEQAVGFVGRHGAPIIGERLIPFLLMVVGFFPISISLVIALESFAGERERRSLEPLLATPLSDAELFIGKMFASLLLPVLAAYIGILVYLIGLYVRLDWIPPTPLLVQVVLLTTAQAVVMVCGAVVISSQTTSVRAANLLASFVILPVSQMIIGESLVMFWGIYSALWFIVVFLFIIAIVLSRMGLYLFNRESLLGREIDVLNFRWLGRLFWRGFRGDASNIVEWYRGVLGSFRQNKRPMLVTALVLFAGFFVGYSLASKFQLPLDELQFDNIDEILSSQVSQLNLMSLRGWMWILMTNLRALLLAALLGIFSFGILAMLALMAPIAIVGYLAGNLVFGGHDVILLLTALVLPHSILEVPAAIISGGAILKLGMVFISPPKGLSLSETWVRGLAELARIAVGLVFPLLVGAALIEAFLTPPIASILLSG